MVAILILASWCRTRWRSFRRRVEGLPFLAGQVVSDQMAELLPVCSQPGHLNLGKITIFINQCCGDKPFYVSSGLLKSRSQLRLRPKFDSLNKSCKKPNYKCKMVRLGYDTS